MKNKILMMALVATMGTTAFTVQAMQASQQSQVAKKYFDEMPMNQLATNPLIVHKVASMNINPKTMTVDQLKDLISNNLVEFYNVMHPTPIKGAPIASDPTTTSINTDGPNNTGAPDTKKKIAIKSLQAVDEYLNAIDGKLEKIKNPVSKAEALRELVGSNYRKHFSAVKTNQLLLESLEQNQQTIDRLVAVKKNQLQEIAQLKNDKITLEAKYQNMKKVTELFSGFLQTFGAGFYNNNNDELVSGASEFLTTEIDAVAEKIAKQSDGLLIKLDNREKVSLDGKKNNHVLLGDEDELEEDAGDEKIHESIKNLGGYGKEDAI